LNSADTYHEKVILPNLLRLVEPKKGDVILDLACGQGYFTRELNIKGVKMTGVDISKELIAIAEQESTGITYHVAPADKLTMIEDKSVDKVVIVLAIQNIQHVENVLNEVARILKTEGTFHITMNHPAFRIPKQSSWGYDDTDGVQYRRVDQYIAESKSEIEMHPGMKDSPKTISFHRPLQYYMKLLGKTGFAVDRFEEWISHKDSDSGPRAKAENRARKEIPLFLYLRAIRTK
jgi:ubiquinone/menaquinone biosynthesis C-methylase UbiE